MFPLRHFSRAHVQKQRSISYGGEAGIGIVGGTGERQRAGAGLSQAAGTADHVSDREGLGRIDHDGARGIAQDVGPVGSESGGGLSVPALIVIDPLLAPMAVALLTASVPALIVVAPE